jgi:2-methylcitrate dehydratase PrpD
MDRVTCYRDPELDALFPNQWPAVVEIVRTDGTRLSHRVDYPKGDPENPLTDAELVAKLVDLTPALDPAARDRVLAALDQAPAGTSLADLADAIGQAFASTTVSNDATNDAEVD